MEPMDDPIAGIKQELVASVNERERPANPNDPYAQDWSERVAYTITSYAEGLERQMEHLKPFIPDIETYKGTELRLFIQGLHSIDLEVKKKRQLNQGAVDQLCNEIERGFVEDEAIIALERKAFFKLAEEKPEVILGELFMSNLDAKPYAQELVEKAAFELVEQGKLEELSRVTYLSEDLPYYKDLMTLAFKRADAEQTVILIETIQTLSSNDFKKFSGSGPWPDEANLRYARESKTKITEYAPEAQIRSAYLLMAKAKPGWLLTKHVSHETPGAKEAKLTAFQNLEPKDRLGYIREIIWILKEELPYLKPVIMESLESSVKDPRTLILTYNSYGPLVEKSTVGGILSKSAKTVPDLFLREIKENENRGWTDHFQNPLTIQNNFSFKDYARIASEELLKGEPQQALSAYSDWDRTHEPAYLFPTGYDTRLIEKILLEKPALFAEDNWYRRDWLDKRPDAEAVRQRAIRIVAERKTRREWIEKELLGTIPAGEKLDDGTPRRKTEAFWKDPALRDIDRVDPQWLPVKKESERAAYTVMVTRNLFFSQKPVSQESVRAEYARLMEVQKEYGTLPLFKDRSVVVLSHNEVYKDGTDRFGKSGLIHQVESASGPGKVQHFEGQNTLESLRKAKEDVLKAIFKSPSPMTFYFDGHGSPDAIYLSDGKMLGLKNEDPYETENTIKITRVELLDALKARHYAGKDISKDILVIDACSSQTFVRNLQQDLTKYEKPSPIFIGVSEYEQYGFSKPESPTGSEFADWIFNTPGNRQVLGDFWRLDSIPYHNPSVFIPPSGSHGLMQVADAEESQSSEAEARG